MKHLYTVPDILRRQAAGDAARKEALVDGPRRITYGELLEQSLRYASVLRDAGLAKGDRVAIYLRRSAETVVALFATFLAGGVGVIIDDALRRLQVNYILEHSEAGLLMTDRRQLLYVSDPAIPKERIVKMDEPAPPRGHGEAPSVIGADLALIIYTSGSTGLPKGVMVSHDNLLAGAESVSDYLDLSEQDILISLLPFSFDYGLNQLLTALLVGGTLVIQRSLLPADVCRTLRREQITGMAGVPTLWLQLLDKRSPFTRETFPHLRYITNSGGGLPESAVRLIRNAHSQVRIHLMYGLTEAFRSTYLPPDQVDRRPTSIGKAIPDVEILVLDDQGRPCAAGEVGELLHRGATVTMGYWRDPASTAKVFRPHPLQDPGRPGRETVVFSGDLVKKDADGYLYFVGRRDQLIKSRGVRVSPDEVERAMFSSELLSNVVAFGVPGTNGDSDIVVAITPKEPATFREEQLREFCQREMPPYMRPSVIWPMADVPRTTSEKPDRPRIRAAYEKSTRPS